MTGPCYAHTKENEPPERWQTLENHLKRVAELAHSFAAEFGAGDWGKKAGVWHDIGKAHPDFQAYLRRSGGIEASEYDEQGTGSHPNHSGAGAILAMFSLTREEIMNLSQIATYARIKHAPIRHQSHFQRQTANRDLMAPQMKPHRNIGFDGKNGQTDSK